MHQQLALSFSLSLSLSLSYTGAHRDVLPLGFARSRFYTAAILYCMLRSATFMGDDVEVDHRTGAQKSSAKIERYDIDRSDAGKVS